MPAVLVHGVPDTTKLWNGVRAHLKRTDIVTPALSISDEIDPPIIASVANSDT